MNIHLESYFLHDLMALLEHELYQGYLVNQEGMLKIITRHYTSRFRALDFSGGLGHFYLDMHLEEDLDILFDIERYHPLRFLYCLEGGFSHSGISGRLQHMVKSGQVITYACTKGQEQRIRFPAGQIVKCIGVQLIRHDFILHRDMSRMPPKIRSVIEDTKAKQPYLLHEAYAHVVAPCLADTVKNEKMGFAGNMLFEAKALEILAHQIAETEEESAIFLGQGPLAV